jgi:hypothetical protein
VVVAKLVGEGASQEVPGLQVNSRIYPRA